MKENQYAVDIQEFHDWIDKFPDKDFELSMAQISPKGGTMGTEIIELTLTKRIQP